MKKSSNELWWLVSTGAAILLTFLIIGYVEHKADVAEQKRRQDSIRNDRQQDSIWSKRIDTTLKDHSELQQID